MSQSWRGSISLCSASACACKTSRLPLAGGSPALSGQTRGPYNFGPAAGPKLEQQRPNASCGYQCAPCLQFLCVCAEKRELLGHFALLVSGIICYKAKASWLGVQATTGCGQAQLLGNRTKGAGNQGVCQFHATRW